MPYKVVKEALGNRIECADVKVPLDWNMPARGTASFALLRVKPADKVARQGSIFFNPGGPGGDGLLFGAIFSYLWNKADPTTAAGAALKKLSDGYDLIGFSPRGTGQSTRLTCGSNEETSPEQYQSEDRSDANIKAMLRNARLAAQACLKNPITPYINTDQTARDLNLARQLLGDSKLNYIGYSYGTWLGAWYAKLFPAQTGHFLLDGNTAFNQDFQASFMAQPQGFERAFREVTLAYAARHDDLFELGTTKEAAYSVYNSFPSAIKLTLQVYPDSMIGALYSDGSIVTIPYMLVAARGFSAVVKAHPELKTGEDFGPLLAAYTYAKDQTVNAVAGNLALLMLDSYVGIVNNLAGPVELGYEGSVFNAVVNNDTPWNQDPNFWVKYGDQAAKDFPLIGGGFTETSAIYWSKPTTTKPALPSTLPPILMLQNEDDPATPREGALPAWKSLPGAKLIFVDNEAQHTAFPYDTECVDLKVATFFIDGTLPADPFTVCQAKPLPGETQVYPVGQDYATGTGLSAQGLKVSAFGASKDSQDALALLRKIIARNAIKPPTLR